MTFKELQKKYKGIKCGIYASDNKKSVYRITYTLFHNKELMDAEITEHELIKNTDGEDIVAFKSPTIAKILRI